jgi:hypothetical protein
MEEGGGDEVVVLAWVDDLRRIEAEVRPVLVGCGREEEGVD